jgi:hypothetical protein
MRSLLHFILSHSIFIAFCSAALSLQTLQLLSSPVNAYLLAFIFFATLCGYNAYWMVSRFSFGNHSSIGSFLYKIRSSLLVMGAAFAGMVLCMTRLHLVLYNVILTFILLGLYAVPVLPFPQLHFTRKAGFVKTILLALSWTIVTILIPLQIPFTRMPAAALLIFAGRFLFMLMLCIIFDNRDAAMDKIRGLQSLATDMRPRVLHSLVALVFVVYALVTWALLKQQVSLAQVVALLSGGAITVWVYFLSLNKRGYIFYYFIVDGMMFLSALLTGLASI